jgi:Transposase
MEKSEFTDSQIMAVLKQAESGISVPNICRELGISSATFYKRYPRYVGIDTLLMARMKELEEEYRRLKKLYIDAKLKTKIVAEGAKDTAFHGTTFMKMNPDGQGGAVLWADEGGLVIQLKNVKGYDVNLATEWRIKKPDGTFGGNRVHGEQEIAVPGKVTAEQIEKVMEVVTFPSGRLRTVDIPR